MSNRLRRRELEGLFLGQKVGEGMSRSVYLLNEPDTWGRHKLTGGALPSPSSAKFVVKVEDPKQGMFQNVSEWQVWEYVRSTPMEKWFAPCKAISPCGLYLIQSRVEPLRKADLPAKMPAFLSDLKRENFGMLGKRLVCSDYGLVIYAIRSASKRLVKANWSQW